LLLFCNAPQKVESFSQKATAAGMDLDGLDPSIREFLAGTMKPEEMVAKRSEARAGAAAERAPAPPPK
jgi:hypothetical protein